MKQPTLLDILGACIMGAILGAFLAYGLLGGGFDMKTLSDAIQYAKQAIKEGVLLDYYFTDNGNIIGISDQGEFIWWRDKE